MCGTIGYYSGLCEHVESEKMDPQVILKGISQPCTTDERSKRAIIVVHMISDILQFATFRNLYNNKTKPPMSGVDTPCYSDTRYTRAVQPAMEPAKRGTIIAELGGAESEVDRIAEIGLARSRGGALTGTSNRPPTSLRHLIEPPLPSELFRGRFLFPFFPRKARAEREQSAKVQ